LSLKRTFFLSFREWIRAFHNLLKENPSSLFMLLGWSSISYEPDAAFYPLPEYETGVILCPPGLQYHVLDTHLPDYKMSEPRRPYYESSLASKPQILYLEAKFIQSRYGTCTLEKV
jgi:hypothetical protein